MLAFARALGEFGATLTFAGSLQGVTRTLPLEIYLQRESDADAAVALSLVLVVVAVVIVLVARGRGAEGGCDRRRAGGRSWRWRRRGCRRRAGTAAGEVVAVLGPNGAGKSTLLSLVAGLERPDRGCVTLDGVPSVDTPPGSGCRRTSGTRAAGAAGDAVPAPDRGRERRLRSAQPRACRGGLGRAPAHWLAAVDADRTRRPATGPAVRWAGAAGRGGPGAGWEPVLLLLDEPMAALDVAVAPALRQLLRGVLRDRGGAR